MAKTAYKPTPRGSLPAPDCLACIDKKAPKILMSPWLSLGELRETYSADPAAFDPARYWINLEKRWLSLTDLQLTNDGPHQAAPAGDEVGEMDGEEMADKHDEFLLLFGDICVFLESGDHLLEQFEERYRAIAGCTKERAAHWIKQLHLALRVKAARDEYNNTGFSSLWDSYIRLKSPRAA